MFALLQRKPACVTALSFRRSHMRAGPFVVIGKWHREG
jgi:hypothetical protein